LEALQAKRLQQFVQRIATTVPYYRELFAQHRIDPASIRSRADLARLPTLDKPTIRAHAEQMKAPGAALKRFNTGGSSGQPLIFWLNERVSHDVAAKWRATRWWDVDIGDPELVLWGSPIEVNTQDRIKMIRDRLLRTELVPAFDLADAGIRHFLDVYARLKPRMLFGYPSALARIASFIEQNAIRIDNRALKVAFVTAERLYPEQRERIQRVFGAPVANGYGSRDAGFLAHECPQGGMHIMAEDVIIETLDNNGQPTAPGVAGEVTVTHLRTGDFPFVRYRTGDVAVLSEQRCSCGRGLPLLANIEGRSTDFVVAENGTVMHGLALIYVVRDIEGVDSFRILQHSLTELEVMLVTPHWDAGKQEKLVRGMQARLGAGVTVTVNRVDHIATEANGKFRYIISKVAQPN
jgi:phenylacetate-CoA ligase